MHTRRVSTFLLGGWIGCSFFMGLVVLQNLHAVTALMNAPSPPVASMIKTLGSQQMTLLLHHQAAEQNRNLMFIWEEVQIVLGLILGGCLYFATQKRLLSLVLCGLMLTLVLFQFWAVMPEMAYRGREMDFPAGNAGPGGMVRALVLYQLLVISEALKLVIGAVLASYLFAFRTSRRRDGRRNEIDLMGQIQTTRRRVGASD